MADAWQRIRAERPCPITGESECEVVATRTREGHPLRNVISVASGLVYVDPLPIEDLAQFYRDEYRATYKNVVVPKRKHVHRAGWVALERWRHAGDVLRPGLRCLDIGAGGGEWVYLMKRLGCESFGVEPNLGYGTFALDHYGVEVFLGMYQDSAFERGSFDVLTLFQVLEHLAEPVEDLRRMSEYLKPGGRLVIEVPDILFEGMRFRNKWHEGHLYAFDVLTLEAVAARAGLRKCSLSVNPGNLFGVFEKPASGEVEVECPDLLGHCEEAKRALAAGKSRYWRLPRTYLRLPRRLAHRAKERLLAERLKNPRDILDHLYDDHLERAGA